MKQEYPFGRRLHLVDVENLVGSPRPTAAEIWACQRRNADLVRPGGQDLCMVACSHGAGAEVAYNWPKAMHMWRSGPDGADLALLGVLTGESVSDRFESVVLASGDGLSAEPATELARCGVHVTVLANRRSLSRRLELASAAVVLFDSELPPAALPAVGLAEAA
jgi:hypothetical protein